MQPMQLPARRTAAAWLNTMQAQGEDDKDPGCWRATLLERHDSSSARLITTDRTMILTAWVAAWDTPDPGIGVRPDPDDRLVVTDPDRLAKQFFSHIWQTTKEEDPEVPSMIDVRTGTLEAPDRPTLAPELDRMALVLSADDQRIQLPVSETPFISWAHTWPTPTSFEARPGVALSARHLGKLGMFKASAGVAVLRHTLSGIVEVTVAGSPTITGLIVSHDGTDQR